MFWLQGVGSEDLVYDYGPEGGCLKWVLPSYGGSRAGGWAGRGTGYTLEFVDFAELLAVVLLKFLEVFFRVVAGAFLI